MRQIEGRLASLFLGALVLCFVVRCARAGDDADVYAEEGMKRLLAAEPTSRIIKIAPEDLTELPAPPEDWVAVRIHNLGLRLPGSGIESVDKLSESRVRIRAGEYVIVVSDLAPTKEMLGALKERHLPYPPTSFEELRQIERASLGQLSPENAGEENRKILKRLILKGLKPAGTYRVIIVETPALKAVVGKARTEKGVSSSAKVYSPGGKTALSLSVANEPDEKFVLKLLGGMAFAAEIMSIDNVSADIGKLCRDRRLRGK